MEKNRILPEERILPESEEKKPEQAIEQPAVVKKADPLEEAAATVDRAMESLMDTFMRSLRDISARGTAQMDAMITKLDEAAGGAPPKKKG